MEGDIAAVTHGDFVRKVQSFQHDPRAAGQRQPALDRDGPASPSTHADGGLAVARLVPRRARKSEEVRYFISSLPPKVKQFAGAVRGHCGIENGLHWVLDVVFGEDASAIHVGHAPENFGFLRRFVISLLKRDTSKGSLRGKRKRAAWSTSFLEKVLGI